MGRGNTISIHAQFEKSFKTDKYTMTLVDKSNDDNIVAVLPAKEVHVGGFDQAFFFHSTDCEGMVYFESFEMIEFKENGDPHVIAREYKPSANYTKNK